MATKNADVARKKLSDILGVEIPSDDKHAALITIDFERAVKLVGVKTDAGEWDIKPDITDKYQRASSKNTIRKYVLQMRGGTWTDYGQPLLFGFVTAKPDVYLMDGKHRLAATVEARHEWSVFALIREYGTEAELQADADKIDIGKARTIRDRLQIDGTYVDFEKGEFQIPSKRLDKLGTALTKLFQGLAKSEGGLTAGVSQGDIVSGMRDWAPYFRVWSDATNADGLSKVVQNALANAYNIAEIVALGIITVRSNPEKGAEFWRRVTQGAEDLRAVHNALTDYKSMPVPELVRSVAEAYNLWLTGGKLPNKLSGILTDKPGYKAYNGLDKASGKPKYAARAANAVPIRILGTPYEGIDVVYYSSRKTNKGDITPLHAGKLVARPDSDWSQSIANTAYKPKVAEADEAKVAADTAKWNTKHAPKKPRAKKSSAKSTKSGTGKNGRRGRRIDKSQIDADKKASDKKGPAKV